MNVAIIDDSQEDRNRLLGAVAQYAKENALMIYTEAYQSGEEFLKKANLAVLDAVFLDIYMAQLSGIDTARTIRSLAPSCQIIFVTASAEFAVESYSVRAFYYILKPYRHAEIAAVLGLLEEHLQKSSRYITVKEGREQCKILLSDILYVDQSNHYVQIHTESAIISTHMRFQEMEQQLLLYREFYSCYRCLLVNMNKIQKVDEFFFLLCNGEYVPINRKRVREIKTYYTDYVFGTIEETDGNCCPHKENL
ncbi:MAG: LytTR family DNA-binding domain-containing protein [Angelakisella sp.]